MSRWETVKRLTRASWPKVVEIVDRVHKLALSITEEQKLVLLAQLEGEQVVEVLEIQRLWKEIWDRKDDGS